MRRLNYISTMILVSIGLTSTGQVAERKIKTIDSLSASIDSNRGLVEGISEGTILNRRGRNIGGYSTYDLKDNLNLYRIRHEVSTDHYYKTTFYYIDKKVVKVTVVIEDWKSDNSFKIIYSATYYFDNNNVIKIDGEDRKYSDSVNLLEQGQKFQTEFKL